MLLLSTLLALALAGANSDPVLGTYHPRTWYQDCLAPPAQASPDGERFLYWCEGRPFLLERGAGARPVAEALGWDDVARACWGKTPGSLFVLGRREGKVLHGFVELEGGHFEAFASEFSVLDAQFAEGVAVVLGRRAGVFGLWVLRDGAEPERLSPRGARMGWALAPAGNAVACLLRAGEGSAKVQLFDLEDGTDRILAEGLDAGYQASWLAFSADGEELYLSLVGTAPPDLAEKQRPDADRDLDLYALSLSGALRLVVEGPGDDLVSGVTAGELLWTRQETEMRTVTVAAGGGELRPLTEGTSSFPTWHPDGQRVAVMYGTFCVADWALNWDIGVQAVGEGGIPSGGLEPIVQGSHEDFGPAWSPDGRWLAYHSHRAPGPATQYSGGGATDDIWMRPTEGGPEVRLTREAGGEVCQPSWSPNGNEMVFVAIDPDTGRYRPVLLGIDLDTGESIAQLDIAFEGIDGDVVAAAFAPNGFELALEERLQGKARLWLASLESEEARLLTEYESLPEFSGLTFDPEGNHIYYTALAEDHHQLFRIDLKGGMGEQLTRSAYEAFTPSVSPDGERVALTLYRHTKTVRAHSLSAR